MVITDGQVRKLRQLLEQRTPLAIAAGRTGMSDKTARHYRDHPTLPSVRRSIPRTYRTRTDPFARNSRSLSWEPSHSAQYEGELPEVHFFPGSIA